MTSRKVAFEGVTPYFTYENAGEMLDWLSRVLGFQERSRYVDKDGVVRQAEMKVGDNELWFGGQDPGYWEKQDHRPDQLTILWVDDVDAHFERVRAAGVEADPPEDRSYDVRSYYVTDPQGYQWGFMRRLGTGYVQTIPTEEGGLKEILADDADAGADPDVDTASVSASASTGDS